MRLQNKAALITGAGSGIGRAAALMMAAEGAWIGALDRNREQAERVAFEILSLGGKALALEADVSDAGAMKHAVSRLDAEWARLDLVFANAGINGVTAPIDEIEPEEWDATMNINLRGAFLTLKYAVPLLRRQGGAVVINSSGQGTRSFSVPGTTAYACSKAALAALGKKMALELARDRIRVNVICPGSTDTRINDSKFSRELARIQLPIEFPKGKTPLLGGRKATAEEVARLVVFLLSDEAAVITGSEVWIDGGMSLMQG